jgi:hypothetical protein
MLPAGKLEEVFALYWQDMERCRRAGAFWSLLHVTVCLPDICAAVQSDNGETSGGLYAAWCDNYLPDPILTGVERYRMRCRVLHQGRASLGRAGRYTGFSFGEPGPNGEVDHRRLRGRTLVLDVNSLSLEVTSGVKAWITQLETHPTSSESVNAAAHLPSLVRVRRFAMPVQPGGFIVINQRTS